MDAGKPPGRLSDYLRSNALALVALFFAVSGGTAMALDESNTVFSDDMVTGEVKGSDIAAGAFATAGWRTMP
jgi:hypothetical protein